jgi:hypothetical protein
LRIVADDHVARWTASDPDPTGTPVRV